MPSLGATGARPGELGRGANVGAKLATLDWRRGGVKWLWAPRAVLGAQCDSLASKKRCQAGDSNRRADPSCAIHSER